MMMLFLFIATAWGLEFKGLAHEIDTGRLLYTELHRVEVGDGLIKKIETRYLDPQGQEFAKLVSDFSRHPTVPNATLDDPRRKRRETIVVADDLKTVRMTVEENGKRIESRELPITDDLVAGQGFDNFIRRNFEKLQKKDVPLRFGVMAKADAYQFLGTKKSGAADGLVRFGIKIDSFLLRLFVEEIDVEYDRSTRRLMRYRGLSNLPSADGKDQRVDITYSFPP